jgi:hypothetical protein
MEGHLVKTQIRLLAAIVAGFVALAPALAATKSDTATVGWFLSEIAKTRGLAVPSEAGAADALKASGVAVPALDAAKVLTEADVVAIGNSLGLTTTTKSPDASLTRTRAQSFLTTFGREIAGQDDDPNATRDTGGEPNDASNNGKGKKKGHNKSASEPL